MPHHWHMDVKVERGRLKRLLLAHSHELPDGDGHGYATARAARESLKVQFAPALPKGIEVKLPGSDGFH